MDFNANQKYFSPEKKPLYIGIILAVLGLLLTGNLRFWFDNSWLVVIPGAVLLIIGGLLIFNFFFAGLKDYELDELVKEETAKAEQLSAEAIAKSHITKVTKTYTCVDYVFDKSVAKQFKKGRDGRRRSDVCCVTVLSLCPGTLCVYTHSFCLTEEKREDVLEKIPLENYEDSELASEIIPLTNGNKTFAVTARLLKLKTKDRVFSIPAVEDVLLFEMTDRIAVVSKKRKDELASEETEKTE